jgi:hypothetical protein
MTIHTDEELTSLMSDLEEVGLGEDPHQKLQRLHARWARTHVMPGTRIPVEEARIIDWQIFGLPGDDPVGRVRLLWSVAHFFLYLRDSGHDAKIVASGTSFSTSNYYVRLGEAHFGAVGGNSWSVSPGVLKEGDLKRHEIFFARETDDLPPDLENWLRIKGLLGRPETIELP